MQFKIALTGDVLATFPPSEEYTYEPVRIFDDSQIVSGNLEMCISGSKSWASTFKGGEWMTIDEEDFRSLRKYGFHHFNFANNHAMDYSYGGLAATIETLIKAGISHSGSGKDLEAANQPALFNIEGCRVAFLGCTGSCDDAARAGYSNNIIPGRPGVNMLRHSQVITVTEQEMKVITDIAEKSCINARYNKSVEMGINPRESDTCRMGSLRFALGSEVAKNTKCNSRDLERIISGIRQLKETKKAEIVVVHIHSHDIKGNTDDTPDDYMIEFAHAAIDAGADIIAGTGTHQLKGIELYREKPIFYSLGNFCFADEKLKYWPYDFTDSFGVRPDIDSEKLWDLRSKNQTVGLEFDVSNYRSIIPVICFDEKGNIMDITIYPIELDYKNIRGNKGFPYFAGYNESKIILKRIQELSTPYHLSLTMERTQSGLNVYKIKNRNREKESVVR